MQRLSRVRHSRLRSHAPPDGGDVSGARARLRTAEGFDHLRMLALSLGNIARIEVADGLRRRGSERDYGREEQEDAFAHQQSPFRPLIKRSDF
jgi:hypothetical protein